MIHSAMSSSKTSGPHGVEHLAAVQRAGAVGAEAPRRAGRGRSSGSPWPTSPFLRRRSIHMPAASIASGVASGPRRAGAGRRRCRPRARAAAAPRRRAQPGSRKQSALSSSTASASDPGRRGRRSWPRRRSAARSGATTRAPCSRATAARVVRAGVVDHHELRVRLRRGRRQAVARACPPRRRTARGSRWSRRHRPAIDVGGLAPRRSAQVRPGRLRAGPASAACDRRADRVDVERVEVDRRVAAGRRQRGVAGRGHARARARSPRRRPARSPRTATGARAGGAAHQRVERARRRRSR